MRARGPVLSQKLLARPCETATGLSVTRPARCSAPSGRWSMVGLWYGPASTVVSYPVPTFFYENVTCRAVYDAKHELVKAILCQLLNEVFIHINCILLCHAPCNHKSSSRLSRRTPFSRKILSGGPYRLDAPPELA